MIAPTRHPDPQASASWRRPMSPEAETALPLTHWFCLCHVSLSPASLRVSKKTAQRGRDFSRLRKAGDTVTRCQPNLISSYIGCISELGASAGGGVSPARHRAVTRQTGRFWWRDRRRKALSLFETSSSRTIAEQGDQRGGAGEGRTSTNPHKRTHLPPEIVEIAGQCPASHGVFRLFHN